MWQSNLEYFEHKKYCKITIQRGNKILSFRDVIQAWEDNGDFRNFYISLLKELPFDAIFWESPPITATSVDKKYEFVAVESKKLASVSSNSRPFAAYLNASKPDETVIYFKNLGGDAVLVVPCAIESESIYTHLIKFLREGKASQCHEFFYKIGKEVNRRLNNKPLWLNTSGLGVYWLHVRLDSRPKYYTYLPYKAVS